MFMSDECVPLAEFMYLVFTGTPGESYRRRLVSLLLRLCDMFRALINSLDFYLKRTEETEAGGTTGRRNCWQYVKHGKYVF